MKRIEMSKYLKMVTAGISVIFLLFILWFLPLILEETVTNLAGDIGYRVVCGFILAAAIPAFLCLWKFWGICERIGQNRSFTMENADALKRMSRYMLTDTAIHVGFLCCFLLIGWYKKEAWLLFPIFLIIFICIALVVVCAALSHLVRKASDMREEQDLTI